MSIANSIAGDVATTLVNGIADGDGLGGVQAPPVISVNPTSQTAGEGSTVTFTAGVSGASSFQWQRQVGGVGVWSDVSGATSSSYAFTATAANQGDDYRIVATNQFGNAISSAASLTVNVLLPSVTWSIAADSRFGLSPSSGSIATWTDVLGGSGTTLTAAQTAATVQTSNSKQVVRMVNSRFTVGATRTYANGLTAFFALKFNATATQTVLQGAGTFRSFMQIGGGSMFVRNEANVQRTLTLPRSLTTGQWIILELVIDSAGNATAFVNGQPSTTQALGAASFRLDWLGDGGGFNFMSADVGAIYIADGVLSNSVRDSMRSYLRGQWATTNYYVSAAGDNSNDGWSTATPKQTIAGLFSAVNMYPGDVLQLRSGDDFREVVTGLANWSTPERTRLTSYGTGRKPCLLGSTKWAGAWALVSGTEYSTPIAYDPLNCFWVPGGNGADLTAYENSTKLIRGTAGSLTAGQYAYASGTGRLHINIGVDPTTQRIEVPANNAAGPIEVSNRSGIQIDNIGVLFSRRSGINFNGGANNSVKNCVFMFNADDGCGASGAAQVDYIGNYIRRNGEIRTAAGGAGDGISYHAGSSGLIAYNTVLDNEKGGIVNLGDCTVTVQGNYIDHCNRNANVIAPSGTPGTHNWYANVIVVRADDLGGIVRVGTSNTTTINAVNNTIVGEGVGEAMRGMNLSRNNIVSGLAIGIADYAGVATDSDYEIVYNCPTAYSGVTPGANSLTTNPQLSSQYRVSVGSPAYRSGVATAVTSDRDGATFTSPPNRGAYA